MTDRLPVVVSPSTIIPGLHAPDIVPALIATAGERACHAPLPGILRGHHPQPTHASGLWSTIQAATCSGCPRGGVRYLVRRQSGTVDHRRAEQQTREHASPTAKLRLAALRHLFDWLVTGQVMPTNPAGSVRGPAHVVKVGKTPVLAPEEARALIDRIEVTMPVGLRDWALGG